MLATAKELVQTCFVSCYGWIGTYPYKARRFVARTASGEAAVTRRAISIARERTSYPNSPRFFGVPVHHNHCPSAHYHCNIQTPPSFLHYRIHEPPPMRLLCRRVPPRQEPIPYTV